MDHVNIIKTFGVRDDLCIHFKPKNISIDRSLETVGSFNNFKIQRREQGNNPFSKAKGSF